MLAGMVTGYMIFLNPDAVHKHVCQIFFQLLYAVLESHSTNLVHHLRLLGEDYNYESLLPTAGVNFLMLKLSLNFLFFSFFFFFGVDWPVVG
jgi:hypothetical protein